MSMFALFCLFSYVWVLCFVVVVVLSFFTVYRTNQMMISYFVFFCLCIFVYTHSCVIRCSSLFFFLSRMVTSGSPAVKPSAGAGWRRIFNRYGWRRPSWILWVVGCQSLFKCFPIDAWKNFEYRAAGFSRKLSGEKPASRKFVLHRMCCQFSSFSLWTSQQNWQIIIMFLCFFVFQYFYKDRLNNGYVL